jgi:alpha-1,2-mannosyltransferase
MHAIDWRSSRNGWGLWAAFLLVLTITVAIDPIGRMGVTLTYRGATSRWWAQQDLYSPGIHGFQYLPQSAILFTPVTWLPFLVGEEVWRWLGVLLLAWGVWRLCRFAGLTGSVSMFLLVTALTIPTAVDAAQTGQANLLFSALLLHATADVARRRWWAAAAFLSLLVVVKPFGLVPLLLVAPLYEPLRWHLAEGLTAVLASPFLFGTPSYVLAQYQLFVGKLLISSHPGPGRWADLTALLWAAGGDPSEVMMTGIRLVLAAGALALSWKAVRRWGGPRASILTLAVATTYLMLCNPRTQENSYVILGPAAAVLTASALLIDRRRWAKALLLAVCVVAGFHRAFSVHPNYWLQPLAALIFAGYLVYITLARPNSTDFMAEYGPAAGNRSRPNPYAIRQRPRHATSMWPNRYDLG